MSLDVQSMGHRQTMQSQIRYHRIRHLIRIPSFPTIKQEYQFKMKRKRKYMDSNHKTGNGQTQLMHKVNELHPLFQLMQLGKVIW